MKSYQTIGRVKRLHCNSTLLQFSHYVISLLKSAFEGATVFYNDVFWPQLLGFVSVQGWLFVALLSLEVISSAGICAGCNSIKVRSARHFSGCWGNSFILGLRTAAGFL